MTGLPAFFVKRSSAGGGDSFAFRGIFGELDNLNDTLLSFFIDPPVLFVGHSPALDRLGDEGVSVFRIDGGCVGHQGYVGKCGLAINDREHRPSNFLALEGFRVMPFFFEGTPKLRFLHANLESQEEALCLLPFDPIPSHGEEGASHDDSFLVIANLKTQPVSSVAEDGIGEYRIKAMESLRCENEADTAFLATSKETRKGVTGKLLCLINNDEMPTGTLLPIS
jgi:hypothetical protein